MCSVRVLGYLLFLCNEVPEPRAGEMPGPAGHVLLSENEKSRKLQHMSLLLFRFISSSFFLFRLISVEDPSGNTLQNNERHQGKAQLLWQAHEEPGGGAVDEGRKFCAIPSMSFFQQVPATFWGML